MLVTMQPVNAGRKANIGAITPLHGSSGFVLGYHECVNCTQGYKVVVPLRDLNEFGKKVGLGRAKESLKKKFATRLLQKLAE